MRDYQVLLKRVRASGCRVTWQRAIILHALCELDGHASVETIHERVVTRLATKPTATPAASRRGAQGAKDVDLSTIYRTLERLCDERILSRTDLGRGATEYEIVTDHPHHHLVCRGCGQVIDLDHAYLAAAQEAIRHDFDFAPVFDHFAIFGLCSRCRISDPDRVPPIAEEGRPA